MCKCINNAPDLTVEDRNHRAISDGFNTVEMVENLIRLAGDLLQERERQNARIELLEAENQKLRNQ